MQNKLKVLGLIGIVLFTLVACGGDDDESIEIIEQTLQGEINGEAWEFKHGRATLDEDQGTVSVSLLKVDVEEGSECSDPADAGPKIIFFRDAAVGSGSLSFEENITFAYETDDAFQNDVATSGTWRFDEVTDEKIVGGLAAEFDGHSVNGTFELVRCADPFANF